MIRARCCDIRMRGSSGGRLTFRAGRNDAGTIAAVFQVAETGGEGAQIGATLSARQALSMADDLARMAAHLRHAAKPPRSKKRGFFSRWRS